MGIPGTGCCGRHRPLLQDAAASVLLFVYALLTDSFPIATETPFLERDPTLSYALVSQPTVSVTLLVVISVVIPVALIAATVLARGAIARLPLVGQTLPLLLRLLLAFVAALGVTLAATNTIKCVAGRQRPNFYALCDYQGYRTTNTTAYDALTVAGRFGSTALCRGDPADVTDAQRSFPSGHSSLSFCGMTFLALFLRWALGVRRREVFSPLAALTLAPLILAAWCALTRVRDRFHNHDDISVGAAIGALASWLSWENFASSGARNPFLRSEEGLREEERRRGEVWPLGGAGKGEQARPDGDWPVVRGGEGVDGGEAAGDREGATAVLLMRG
jgi:membrane-associated phospholipid phosphatase